MWIFLIVLLMILIVVGVLMYFIGCLNGFKKCKQIDDEIINKLINEKHILFT